MGMRLDCPRRDDVEIAMDHRRIWSSVQFRVDTVHNVRVPGFANADDAAVPNADIGLHNALHRVDDGGVLHHHIKCARCVRSSGLKPLPVPHILSSTGGEFVTVSGVILLNLG